MLSLLELLIGIIGAVIEIAIVVAIIKAIIDYAVNKNYEVQNRGKETNEHLQKLKEFENENKNKNTAADETQNS